MDGQNFYWALGCRCSGRGFAVRSRFAPHFYLKHSVAYGRIALRCGTCARECVCFHPSEHGFDAELDHFPPADDAQDGEVTDFACPGCAASSFQVVARFEYPYSTRFGQATQSPGPAEEDLFTYFMLLGTCESCGLISVLADVQCA